MGAGLGDTGSPALADGAGVGAGSAWRRQRRVSLFLGALHPDYAALRRYLVDEDFLTRSAGVYWRGGGTVPPSPDR